MVGPYGCGAQNRQIFGSVKIGSYLCMNGLKIGVTCKVFRAVVQAKGGEGCRVGYGPQAFWLESRWYYGSLCWCASLTA